MTFNNLDLFNNYPNLAEPDWSQFDWLELGGCVDVSTKKDRKAGNTCYEGGYSRHEADIFTIYGHYNGKGGFFGLDAITDCKTFEDAQRVAAELSRRSGLRVDVTC